MKNESLIEKNLIVDLCAMKNTINMNKFRQINKIDLFSITTYFGFN